MNSEVRNIIGRLERQGKAIEKAIAALRELDGPDGAATAVAGPAPATPAKPKPGKRKGMITEEGRRRISEALRARWAARRAAAGNGKKRGVRKAH